jgi:sugar transferase (PEP-CTERM system associated)
MIRIFSQYVSAKALVLMTIEGVLIASAMLGGIHIRFWNSPVDLAFYTALPDFAIQVLLTVVVFQICFYYNELYDLTASRRRAELWTCLGQAIGLGCLIMGFLYFLVPALLIGGGVFFISLGLASALLVANRVLLDKAWAVTPFQNVLILGTGTMAMAVARELNRREDLNVRLIGLLEDGAAAPGSAAQVFGHTVFKAGADLEALVTQEKISRIIVAQKERRGILPIRALVTLRVRGVQVEDVASAIAALTGRVWLNSVHPSWFVFSGGFRRSRLTGFLKRVVDVLAACALLLLAAPLMLIVAVMVRLDSRGPALYRQIRVGLGGREFMVLKFRSMRPDAETGNRPQWATEHDPRVTRVGRFLRKYRLDELPQLINVLRGEMSFVGPRPERPAFVERLRDEIAYYDERHSVRPGLTGWAQVQYSYGSSVEDALRKLEYDLFYLKHMSPLFDLAIMFQTVRIVFTGHGAR